MLRLQEPHFALLMSQATLFSSLKPLYWILEYHQEFLKKFKCPSILAEALRFIVSFEALLLWYFWHKCLSGRLPCLLGGTVLLSGELFCSKPKRAYLDYSTRINLLAQESYLGVISSCQMVLLRPVSLNQQSSLWQRRQKSVIFCLSSCWCYSLNLNLLFKYTVRSSYFFPVPFFCRMYALEVEAERWVLLQIISPF